MTPHLKDKGWNTISIWLHSREEGNIQLETQETRTVNLVSRRQEADVGEGNFPSVPVIKLYHHSSLLPLIRRTTCSKQNWTLLGSYKLLFLYYV